MSYVNVPMLYFSELQRILNRDIKDLHVENVAQFPDEFSGQDYLGPHQRACLIRCDSDELLNEKSSGYEDRWYEFRLRVALIDVSTDQEKISDLAEHIKYVLKAEKFNGDIWQHLSAGTTNFDEVSETDLGANIKVATITVRILRDG